MSTSDGDHMAIFVQIRPMAILRWSMVMVRIVLVIWVGTVAYADNQMVRMSHTTDMIGKLVKDGEGNVLGRIHDLVFHWRSDGYTEYAVLSLGGLFGEGEEHIAVPWEALKQDTRKDHVVLNLSKVELNDDPELVVYRLYDRSFAAVLGAGRSTAASSAHAMMDNIESAANASWTRSFGIQNSMVQDFKR
jgi:sporulation protein YlmC with PRC-barrel domain